MTTRKSLILFTGAPIVLILLAYSILANPPVRGYYRSELMAFLDGSTAYLYLHDGIIDLVNIGGKGRDSQVTIGAYDGASRSEIHMVFKDPQLAPQTVSVDWVGFDFSPDFAKGFPSLNHCYREILPWRLHRMNQMPKALNSPPSFPRN